MNEEAYVKMEAEALNALSDFIGTQVKVCLCVAAEVPPDGKEAAEIEERYLSAVAEIYRDATRGW